MSRVYERTFDWEEARRLHEEEGLSVRAIARRLGVSTTAMYFAVNPQTYERAKALNAAWQRSGTCEECGGPCTRKAAAYRRGVPLCHRCAAFAYQATNVRPGEQRCITCREWKPNWEFPRNKSRLTGRHSECTPCQTKARTEWRRRHWARENAYNVERKRRIGRIVKAQCDEQDRCTGCGKGRRQPSGAARFHDAGCVFSGLSGAGA